MTPGRPRLVAALAAALGACGHARSTEAPEPARARPGHEANASPAHEPARGAPRVERDAKTGIPVAPSRVALLEPGAVKAIQERLMHRGELDRRRATDELDAETRAALSRFQRDQGLPATGDPDQTTIEKLGLRVGDVFVSSKRD